jgi:gamma-glutamyltranspeptidase/glutathione hydrolase
MARRAPRRFVPLVIVTVALLLAPAVPAVATPLPAVGSEIRGDGWDHRSGTPLPKVPVMTGSGGAVASVDRDASQVGIDVLRAGGNAADAAVATAAALGVTEPFSAGIGGGGFLVYYDAKRRKVFTIDGRETAPATFTERTFLDRNGEPLVFADVVSSGLSVGVPGTPALWEKAAHQFGTRSLRDLLRPAEQLAEHGFVVDETFAQQTSDNAARFSKFPETARIFLPGGSAPAVGSTFRNPDLAVAYRALRRHGVEELYRGDMGDALVQAAREPVTASGVSVYPGQITSRDLRRYRVLTPEPTRTEYRGLDIYGMPVPSSGGIAVGESLNLIEAYEEDLTGESLSKVDDVQYLHRLAEANATAFADRNRWVGDVRRVPSRELLSQRFADERACQLFDPARAAKRPIPFGDPDGRYSTRPCPKPSVAAEAVSEEHGTTNLTVTDRWGNVAEYTLTIEQTGGSGITVPGYGFLLNNELTDFTFKQANPKVPDPNLPGPGKRPRSSMSPTIVLDDGRPVLALGSPGGATIITTVTHVLLGHLDRDLALVDAIAAPRLSSRNSVSQAEPAILDGPLGEGLKALGHELASTPEIGAATAIRLLPDGRFEAAAETTRRGGGSAMVVRPR